MRSSFARRKDKNEALIVQSLEAHGCRVDVLSRYGFPCDLMVSRNKRTVLMEVKNPELPPSERKLTPKEIEFAREFQGEYAIVFTPFDALSAMGLLT